MFDPAQYQYDPERITQAVESGAITEAEVLGVTVCFVCKHERELAICTHCGQGYCKDCPAFCDCRVNETLASLRSASMQPDGLRG